VAPVDDVRALVAVLGELKRFQPHIVHTHTAKAGTIGRTAAFAYNRFARTAARTVHTYHGHSLEGYFRSAAAFIAIERALAPATDRLIAVAPAIAADLQQRYRIGRPDQYIVVPLGFDLAPFTTIDADARAAARHALGIDASANVATIVGRLTAIKQHDLFLRVARAVRDDAPGTTFLIVGDGELRPDLERLAAALGIGAAVQFLGWRKDLTTIYAASDVCVLTSRNEGTPVALIEALAAGIPVVSTDVGGVRDVVGDPALGSVAPDGDVHQLAGAVGRALSPDARRADLVDARRRSATTRYGFDRLAADITALYRSLLDA
jgi:glycosyltransferase involved in cell wall biosynthesis